VCWIRPLLGTCILLPTTTTTVTQRLIMDPFHTFRFLLGLYEPIALLQKRGRCLPNGSVHAGIIFMEQLENFEMKRKKARALGPLVTIESIGFQKASFLFFMDNSSGAGSSGRGVP